jgi:hypothetical protein
MINELSRNPLFFLRYFPPEPSRISHTPHSHSIVLIDSRELIFLRKFSHPIESFRLWGRQSSGLLILKRKIVVPENSRFQGLSAADE